MVRSLQTVQLSCVKISTISEQTKSSLHLSLFNYEFHWVRLKWFPSLWCIRRKPCTYLLPKLTFSLNEPKQDSIWHTSWRSYIRWVLIDFYAYRMFHANVHLSCIKISTISKLTKPSFPWAPRSRSTIGCVQNGFLSYGAFGANCVPILHRN